MKAETKGLKERLNSMKEKRAEELIRRDNERLDYERTIQKTFFSTERQVKVFPKQPNGVTIVRYDNSFAESVEDLHSYDAVIDDKKRLNVHFSSYNSIQAYTLTYLGGNPELALAVQKLCNLVD